MEAEIIRCKVHLMGRRSYAWMSQYINRLVIPSKGGLTITMYKEAIYVWPDNRSVEGDLIATVDLPEVVVDRAKALLDAQTDLETELQDNQLGLAEYFGYQYRR